METTKEKLEYQFGVNVFGIVYLAQAVVGLGSMPKGGRIINIGSISSRLNPPGTSIYSAAKAAQDSLTTGLAGEVSSLQEPRSHAHIHDLTPIRSLARATESRSTHLHQAKSQPICQSHTWRIRMELKAQ